MGAIKKESLAGSLNTLLTDNWQRNIRTQNTQNNFKELYKNKFGQESYEKIKEFREWLLEQPNKDDLKYYILA